MDTEKITDLSFTANIILPDENYVMCVKNGIVLYQKDCLKEDADVVWTTNQLGLLSIIQKNPDNVAALVAQDGDETYLTKLMDAVVTISDYMFFNIVEP